MKGSAPKSPTTGSQVDVVQKPNPNLRIDSHDSLVRTTPMPATIATTSTANAPVLRRKPRSPWRPHFTVRGFSSSGDTNLRQRRELHLHDFGWQWRVAEIGGVLLPVGERPL